ncbi:MAG: hypothetical protein KBS97_01305 [Firmicutes bacterium]|nr:hypothetical protein [Candidatus Fiminaster equi]
MNNYTAAIASFIRFDVIVFNTLEYAMKKDSYDVDAYKARKEIISNEISQNTPLKNCLANSGDAGKALNDKINDLLKLIYSDDSTIVKLSQDGKELRVDFSQAISVFEAVLPIHEEMKKIVEAHVVAAKKAEQYDEPTYPEVIEKEEYFYRGLVNMLMLDQFDHQFAEYNKARQEAKGGITAQSNFIQNDINRLVKLFHFVRDNAFARNAEYYSVIDPLFALIEMTGGRRDLPEGKNFGQIFTDVKTIAREKTQKWELAWKPVYEAFIKHFTEEVQKMQGGAKA